jgi:hypothetical protein
MNNEKQGNQNEQDLSRGELIDQEPLEAVEDPPSRLADNNQIPNFGDDTEGTLQESEKIFGRRNNGSVNRFRQCRNSGAERLK